MAITIVSKRLFLLADAIHYITLNDFWDDRTEDTEETWWASVKRRLKGHCQPMKQKHNYRLTVYYVPHNSGQHPSAESMELYFSTAEKAEETFCDVVKEIRDQCPDDTYLDSLVESMMLGDSDTKA